MYNEPKLVNSPPASGAVSFLTVAVGFLTTILSFFKIFSLRLGVLAALQIDVGYHALQLVRTGVANVQLELQRLARGLLIQLRNDVGVVPVAQQEGLAPRLPTPCRRSPALRPYALAEVSDDFFRVVFRFAIFIPLHLRRRKEDEKIEFLRYLGWT